MGMALNTNGDLAMQQVNFLACGVFPEKLDAAVAQLEAEPAGVGLDPAEAYEGLSHAASAVLSAVSRVAQRVVPSAALVPAKPIAAWTRAQGHRSSASTVELAVLVPILRVMVSRLVTTE